MIVAVVPGVVLLPWTFHLFASPSAFLLEAGLARSGMAAAGLRPGSLLLLSPGGPGLPPVWVTAGLVLPAFCALLLRRRMALVYSGWAIALAGLVVALVVSRVRVTPPQGGPAVSAWPGVAIAIAAAGLLLAAVPVIEALWRAVGLSGDRPSRDRPSRDRQGEGQSGARPRWRSLALLAALAATASAPLLAAGSWLTTGVRGPLTTAAAPILPAFVAAASAGPDRPRTLVLRPDGGVLAYTVLRTSDPTLGEPELTQLVPATRALDAAVASLAAASAGDGGDPSQALSQFDIGYVLLPAPIDQTLAHQLDGAAGLVSLTQAPAYDLWRVAGTVARVRIVTSGGTVIPVPSGSIGAGAIVPAGISGTLQLAEAAGGWSATLDGRPLASLARPADGWAQGFTLPAGGGSLLITRNETARDLSLGAEAAAVLVTFVLALPGTRATAQASAPAAVADADEKPAGSRRRRESAGRKRGRRPELAGVPLRARGRRSSGARDAAVAAGVAPDLAPTAAGPDLALARQSGLISTTQSDPIPTTRLNQPPDRLDAAPTEWQDLSAERVDLPPDRLDHPPDWLDPVPDATPGIRPEMTPATRPDAAPGGRQDAVRRQRGGAHAARHGKPSRRWRPGPADRTADRAPDRPPASASEPVRSGPESSQVSQYSPAITKDRAENGEAHDDAVPQDSGQPGRRPPWELGNRS